MHLTSEQAHWIVGGELLLLAFLLLAYETYVWRPAGLRFALAMALLVFAAEGMLGPLVQGDLAPERLRTETIQHVVMGAACLGAGVVEGFRALGRLRHDVWRTVLPLAMLTLAAIFAFHAQDHAPGVSHTLLTMQHRILAATLAVGGMAKGAAELRHPVAQRLGPAWLFPVLLAALQLLLYTEG
jgi:hypothetical protein